MQKEIQSSIEIFCSYSHKDETLRVKFDPVVKNLQRQNQVQLWHDRKILAGADWAGDIDQHLNSADIVVLLVSSDFLASDYCYEKEMSRAMERESKKEAVVVPVIVRPCDWQDAPFGKLQALPTGGKAVTTWKNRDEAWTTVSIGLKGTIRSVLTQKAEQLQTQVQLENPGVNLGQILMNQQDLKPDYSSMTIYQMMESAGMKIPNRMEQFRALSELQQKIDSITREIGPDNSRTVEKAFNNMDQYIKGD